MVITLAKNDTDSSIRVNDKLAVIDNRGNWIVGGVQASKKLSNYLDGIYKDVVWFAEGAVSLYRVKL